MEQKAGLSAIMAIVAALLSYVVTFGGRPVLGFLAALAAIPLGAFGLIRAASPRVSGGLMSIAAIVLALIAIGVSVLGMIGAIVF